MTDLSTSYLGLRLRTPIVASAGPLTGQLATLRELEAAGVAAVVLPSLFEERATHDAFQLHEYFETGADSQPEATNYTPDVDYETAGEAYLRLVQRAQGRRRLTGGRPMPSRQVRVPARVLRVGAGLAAAAGSRVAGAPATARAADWTAGKLRYAAGGPGRRGLPPTGPHAGGGRRRRRSGRPGADHAGPDAQTP